MPQQADGSACESRGKQWHWHWHGLFSQFGLPVLVVAQITPDLFTVLTIVLLRKAGTAHLVTATRYSLDGPGIESRWGVIFRASPEWPWDPPSFLNDEYRVSIPGVKRPGRGVNHVPSSSAEVKERVQLYLYSPFGPSWEVTG